MPRALSAVLALALALLAAVLPAPARAAVRVVATVPDLAALAAEVAGDRASVTSLSLPTQDPHFVDAKPSLALAVSRADVLLAIGLDLEVGWLATLQAGSRNPRIQKGARGYVDCSQFVRPLDVPTHKVDRSMGDIHPGGNPHYLYDPRQAVAVARGIAARLAEVDPASAATYRSRAEAFAAQVEKARARWEATLAPLRGAAVVAYHKSFPYLEAWLGFRVVEHIEPRPGIPPTPAHIAHVLAAARQHGARLVLQEEFYGERDARVVADKVGARVVRVPGGTDFPRGETYVAHVDRIVALLRAGLGAG